MTFINWTRWRWTDDYDESVRMRWSTVVGRHKVLLFCFIARGVRLIATFRIDLTWLVMFVVVIKKKLLLKIPTIHLQLRKEWSVWSDPIALFFHTLMFDRFCGAFVRLVRREDDNRRVTRIEVKLREWILIKI